MTRQQIHTKEIDQIFPPYVDCIFHTIGRKRAIFIMLQLRKQKKLRNKELVKKLGGISPSTLSSLLRDLIKEGLLQREVYGEIPPIATEYSLTKNGNNFLNALDPLLKWLINNR